MGIPMGVVDSIVEATLELNNLQEFRCKKIGILSEGIKRRLQLALAMIGQPKLLILVCFGSWVGQNALCPPS